MNSSVNTNYPVFPGHEPILGNYSFSLEQVTKLCEMQDTLNSYIHPEWMKQNFYWMLAIQDEIMEIHGHLGWKWWKQDYKVGLTQENLKQVQLEVIDILHFVISKEMLYRSKVAITSFLNDLYARSADINWAIVNLQRQQNNYGAFLLECWADLARCVGLTEQMILETYTHKYVLNKFRQDHGYKDGSYTKLWQTGCGTYMEDNEALAQIVTGLKLRYLDSSDEQLLYSELETSYNSRLNQ